MTDRNTLDVVDELVRSLQARISSSLLAAIGAGVRDIALLDFPNHANVGDSAIWIGEVEFLRSSGLRSVYGCDLAKYDAKKLAGAVADAPILLHGGGNFGDIWPAYQTFRHSVLENFPNNPIIQLPQTIHFSDAAGAEKTRRLIEHHGGFKLFVRDAKSLVYAQEHFPDSNPELCPDAAFMLGRLRSPVPATRDIVFLRRTDKEQRTEWRDIIAESATRYDMEVVDWLEEPFSILRRGPGVIRKLGSFSDRSHPMLERAWIATANRLAMVRLQRGLAILGRGRVVVTDRLHAHILATLLGLPQVILDNNYGKLSTFIDAWTSELDICHVAKEPAAAIHQAAALAAGARDNPQ